MNIIKPNSDYLYFPSFFLYKFHMKKFNLCQFIPFEFKLSLYMIALFIS